MRAAAAGGIWTVRAAQAGGDWPGQVGPGRMLQGRGLLVRSLPPRILPAPILPARGLPVRVRRAARRRLVARDLAAAGRVRSRLFWAGHRRPAPAAPPDHVVPVRRPCSGNAAAMTRAGLSWLRLTAGAPQVQPRASAPGCRRFGVAPSGLRAAEGDAMRRGWGRASWGRAHCDGRSHRAASRGGAIRGNGAAPRAVVAPGQRRPLRGGLSAPPASAGPAGGKAHGRGLPWSPPAVGLSGGRQQRSAPCRSPLSTSRPPSSSSRWMR